MSDYCRVCDRNNPDEVRELQQVTEDQAAKLGEQSRELAVARQTIRSLQNALASSGSEREQALREERDRAVDVANAAYEYDSATRQENRSLREREQELTNALRRVANDKHVVGAPAGESYERVKGIARAALAPAVEEQREKWDCSCPFEGPHNDACTFAAAVEE